MPTRFKNFAPAAERNQDPIRRVLDKVLPRKGLVLEVASGTGQHAAYFSQSFPLLQWQPTERDAESLAGISAWRKEAGQPNFREPLQLDVEGEWPVELADALLAINLVHICPWETTEALFRTAHTRLPEGGVLFLYGPYFEKDVPTAPSNTEFDASLRSRNPRWGIRDLGEVLALAKRSGFFFQDRFAMPANNLSLVFRKEIRSSSIRPAIPSDDSAVGDLLVRVFTDTYAEKMPEVVVTERRIAELRDFEAKRKKGVTWVAELDGAIVGTVYLAKPGQEGNLVWSADLSELKQLAVEPILRKSGLSEALVQEAVEQSLAWSAAGVGLHVRRGANGVARFYSRLGFDRFPNGDFDRLPEVFLEAYWKKAAL